MVPFTMKSIRFASAIAVLLAALAIPLCPAPASGQGEAASADTARLIRLLCLTVENREGYEASRGAEVFPDDDPAAVEKAEFVFGYEPFLWRLAGARQASTISRARGRRSSASGMPTGTFPATTAGPAPGTYSSTR